jgi:hypothetical protein
MENSNPEAQLDLTVEDLLQRGWTRGLIDLFLGNEDYRNPVNHFRNYSGKKMFMRRRVELVEASPEFECAFITSAKRRKMPEAAVDEVLARIALLRADRERLGESDVGVQNEKEIAFKAQAIAEGPGPAWARGYRTPHKC